MDFKMRKVLGYRLKDLANQKSKRQSKIVIRQSTINFFFSS